MTLTDYEREREERIAKNRALLASLNLPKAVAFSPKRIVKAKPKPAPQKRKRDASSGTRGVTPDSGNGEAVKRRVSARLQSIKQRRYEEEDSDDDKPNHNSDYSSEYSESEDDVDERKNRRRESRGPIINHGTKNGLSRRTVNGRNVAHIDPNFERPNPKTFGAIGDIQNGHWWATRMECSRDGVHAPTVAGISGNEKEGCWSIALSGGYEDDVDEGYCFTYTGSGGRDLKGTKNNPKNLRTAPQSSDQTCTGLNLALKVSCDTGNPVRVVRGFKGHGKWAPNEGYRYDGLYRVVKHWEEVGLAGFLVMKYAFVRMEGQDDIRVDVQGGEDQEEEEEEEESNEKDEPDNEDEEEVKELEVAKV